MDNKLSVAQIKEINDTARYVMFSVFTLNTPLGDDDRDHLISTTRDALDKITADGVVIRGTYDLSGLRSDADLMFWWHAPSVEALQSAYNTIRKTPLGRHLTPRWSNVGLTRPAEFNRSHIPAFMADETPKNYVCVYPFVRSYDWYLLPDQERRTILAEHGRAARDYPDVRANTVPAFALGDYEWLLAFEADELIRIVDLMRDLRATEARRHVREEIPFFTGPRKDVADIIRDMP